MELGGCFPPFRSLSPHKYSQARLHPPGPTTLSHPPSLGEQDAAPDVLGAESIAFFSTPPWPLFLLYTRP